jgi:hypothetical protein
VVEKERYFENPFPERAGISRVRDDSAVGSPYLKNYIILFDFWNLSVVLRRRISPFPCLVSTSIMAHPPLIIL